MRLFLSMLMVLATGCSVVGPGQRGIRIFSGSASTEVKEPGMYLWIPVLLGMAKVNVQVQKSEMKTSAASKDMQEITTEIAVNWKLSPEKAVETYKNIGDEDEVLNRIIHPAVSEVLKASTAQYTAEEILHKRMELKSKIDEGLKARLNTYGITMFDVSITQLRFTDGFEHAVENKQIAEQRSKQAEYEALQAIQTAKGEVEKARGQAAAQTLLKSTITKEILQQRAIEKWDGHFPQVMGGQGALPFLNINVKD